MVSILHVTSNSVVVNTSNSTVSSGLTRLFNTSTSSAVLVTVYDTSAANTVLGTFHMGPNTTEYIKLGPNNALTSNVSAVLFALPLKGKAGWI